MFELLEHTTGEKRLARQQVNSEKSATMIVGGTDKSSRCIVLEPMDIEYFRKVLKWEYY